METFLSLADELQVTGLSGSGLSNGAGVEQNGDESIDGISNGERQEEEEGGQNENEKLASPGTKDEVKAEVKEENVDDLGIAIEGSAVKGILNKRCGH